MGHRRFPLPEGHMYAPRVHVRCHDGTDGMEGLWLSQLQQTLRLRWRMPVNVSGRYDIATQAALTKVQQVTGCRDPDGYLDHATWDAVFTTEQLDTEKPQT